jgi:glycosyltransferase involved in cell wall biosynthesis
MTPLVSILIPAFNAEDWIADSIKSAIGQTWQRKEIIIVDDGSTDQTVPIAQRFASKELRVVTQPNQGASAARNTAFSLCQGDFIQWLDADDLLAPDKIARQMEALEGGQEKRILLSSAWGRFMYRVSRAEFVPTRLWCDLSPTEWMIRKMSENIYMQTGAWLVSRELSDAAGSWNTQLYVDNDGEYFCRVILASDGVRFVSQARTYYRRSGYSCLSYIGTSDRKLEAKVLSMQLQVRHLRSIEDSPRVREACIRYLQTWLICLYPNRCDLVEKLKRMAIDLNGNIEFPSLSWKYNWLRRLFGWDVAKRARSILPMVKWSVIRYWDKALYRVQNLSRLASAFRNAK